jgi:MFS family permease
MSAENTSLRKNALELLRRGPFRRYIIGAAISDTGTWMQVMAQGWVVSTLTNRAIVLGLVNLAAGLPTLALTMYGGSLADRHDKRKILIATQVVQIISALFLGYLVMTSSIQIWHVIILATVLGASIAFEMPAISALVPELVEHEQIGAAINMDRAVFHGSRFIGSSVAGILVSAWGAASAFFANAISFVALIIAIGSLPARRKGTKEEEEQRRSSMMDGLRYVKSDHVMVAMIALIALTTIFVFPVVSPVMLPLYVRNILHLGPRELGWLMAMSATGAFSGALGLLTVAPEKRYKFMTANAIAIAAGLFCMSLSTSFWLTAPAMTLLAVGLSMNFGLANTIVQERAPSALRGRISAVFGMSFFGLMPIAGLLVPGLSDLIGMRTALGVTAVLFAIGAFLILHAAGRKACEASATTIPEARTEPEPVVVP